MLSGEAMAKIRVAYEYTEAEDKSIRLGLFLIVSGIVSLFILGFCWLNPALQDLQGKAANCTVLSVQQIGELFECTFTCGADCKGTSLYPCLQIYVNHSESDTPALLHQDEHQLLTNPKVSPARAEEPRQQRRAAAAAGFPASHRWPAGAFPSAPAAKLRPPARVSESPREGRRASLGSPGWLPRAGLGRGTVRRNPPVAPSVGWARGGWGTARGGGGSSGSERPRPSCSGTGDSWQLHQFLQGERSLPAVPLGRSGPSILSPPGT